MHIEFKVVFQQHRVRDSACGPVQSMPSPGELETNNTYVCPNTNNAGESPFLKPSECPDQIPSAEQNLIFFHLHTHTHTRARARAQRIISLLNHNTFGHLSLASNHTFIQLSLYPKAHYLLVLPPRIIAVKSTLLFAIIDTLLFFSTRSFSFL